MHKYSLYLVMWCAVVMKTLGVCVFVVCAYASCVCLRRYIWNKFTTIESYKSMHTSTHTHTCHQTITKSTKTTVRAERIKIRKINKMLSSEWVGCSYAYMRVCCIAASCGRILWALYAQCAVQCSYSIVVCIVYGVRLVWHIARIVERDRAGLVIKFYMYISPLYGRVVGGLLSDFLRIGGYV